MVLMPIFLGFLVTHSLIGYGVGAHADRLPELVAIGARHGRCAGQMGWVFVLSVLLRAYSLGGGTYTGIEAVSNNVQRLAEPRVETGRLTMLYMATSLAFIAGGIILLYLLWDVRAQAGQTLNAVAFRTIIESWQMWRAGSARACSRWCCCSRSRACSSSPPIPASSAARRCFPTWRATIGCRTNSAICRPAW